MKQRCRDPKHNAYHRYGGRGISIHPEWLTNYRSFQEWAMNHGYADDLTIDRIDNGGDYSPENCRWVSQKVQLHNTSTNVLSMAEADRIRAEYASGSVSMRKLAKRHSCVVSMIHRVIHRQSWIE